MATSWVSVSTDTYWRTDLPHGNEDIYPMEYGGSGIWNQSSDPSGGNINYMFSSSAIHEFGRIYGIRFTVVHSYPYSGASAARLYVDTDLDPPSPYNLDHGDFVGGTEDMWDEGEDIGILEIPEGVDEFYDIVIHGNLGLSLYPSLYIKDIEILVGEVAEGCSTWTSYVGTEELSCD